MSNPVACHVCGGHLAPVGAYPVAEQVTSDCRPWRGENKLAFCVACGVVQKPVSGEWLEEIQKIYSAYAVYEQGGGADQASFDAVTGGAMARSERIVAWLGSRGQLAAHGSMLDIGCGNGAFLQAFGKANSGWAMMGLELDARNKERIEAIPGVTRLHVGPLGSLGQKFDLIVMIHALEHIPGPDTFLREIVRSLKPGGRLLIQVPDLHTSPFDLLIADHCTHFSQAALSRLVIAAGYEVRHVDPTCVATELTLLAEPAAAGVMARCEPSTLANDALAAQGHVEWMHQVLRQAHETPGQVAVFGTSISGTWLASALGGKVSFFVDEDPHRVGRTQLGKPIYSPAQAPQGVDILMPMQKRVAAAIAKRLASFRLNLIEPPSVENRG